MTWLQLQNETPAAPVDLSKARAALAELESVFPTAATARKRLEDQHGPVHTPQKAHQIATLKAETERAAAQARVNVEQALADAMKVAARNVGKAQRDYSTSVDGTQEREALAGFAMIGAKLSGDQIAERLNAALDAGLIGQARAWRQVADLQPYSDSVHLTAATMRANREAVTPAEVVANGQAAYVQRAMQNLHLWGATIDSRLSEVVDEGKDEIFVGNFSEARIFGGGEQ